MGVKRWREKATDKGKYSEAAKVLQKLQSHGINQSVQ
jgi:hypothetical protein